MLVPQNHDKLQACSLAAQEDFARLDADKVPYYDDRFQTVAARAIKACMPELSDLLNQTIVVDALEAVSIEDDETQSFNEIHVGGRLLTVRIQQVVEDVIVDDLSLQSVRHDLCAILTPTYVEPDPRDIVFGKELYVPFSSIQRFEEAS